MDLKDFSKTLRNIPEITQEELIDLSRRSRSGDLEARKELIERNIPLVITVAARNFHKAKHLQRDDLLQQATLGLIQAVDRYDPYKINPKNNRPYRFSTYAVFWIEHYIQHALQFIEDEIHVPFQRMKESDFDNPVSHSLDDPQLDEKTEMEILAGPDLVGQVVFRDLPLKEFIESAPLTGIERETLKLRSGLADEISRTEREIAAVLGIEISEVREFLKMARMKMQESLSNEQKHPH